KVKGKKPSDTVGTAIANVAKKIGQVILNPIFHEEPEEGAAAPAGVAAAPGQPQVAEPAPSGDGEEVKAAPKAGGNAATQGLQKALKKLGYDPGAIDGISGPKTKAAIQKFQQANGLSADGIAGPKTQAALAKALQGAGAA